ncbi:MAG: hypothetical protein A2087_03295 [Spirochaetes bacterium GWD1_61_31]|nr:MAG: hypothetical protein A2Y37_05875 [Spirochaetes bacterium GWB1_60_80]OHD33789.1 MAG: hypothetical protein A2004_08820 [Spirochaetes bacterium GWC1_61_12]OHD35471.1 MAG: hypothetical protein A2087_03295 [Spirochaetes bacterium GWD1_61_31]OHD41536.1 MAG: hypothetical protein A2Y35_09655 [Spirochaetes bacterium GWE1_60_18]OHD61436.1 MAG: hypothetical protein A2Y32_09730 [Spirochaetes bacterium GWF1_60_12]HAP44790.1 magnesium transporter [Spirochaetaceae bacterium]
MTTWYGYSGGKLAKAAAGSPVEVVVAPEPDEIQELVKRYGIDLHDLHSALDPDELARVESETDHLVLILKLPCNYTGEGKLLFTVTSVGMFLFKSRLLVVSPNEVEFSGDKVMHAVKDVRDVMLKIMYGIIDHFLGHLKVINMLSESLEKRMTESMGNRYLMDMFALEKSLVYFVNGLSSNQVVFEKLVLETNKVRLKLTKARFDILEDVVTENRQCQKQAEIYSDILMGLMGAHASVVNNNISLLMKRLTVISIVFMPLNVVAGMGGMSEFSNWTSGVPWYLAYGIFLVSLVPLSFLTYLILKRSGIDRGESETLKRTAMLRSLPRIPGRDRPKRRKGDIK